MKRQKSRNISEQPQKRERILVFDIIRVLCVAIIVYVHSQFFLIPAINKFLFPDGFGPFNIYPAGLDGYAVYGMIFISGAVLEYNYQGIEKLHGYLQFLFRRFIRIYPAFWMSLIFGLILFIVFSPSTPLGVWVNGIPGILFEFTGFFVVLGQGNGNINNMGWFIATIFSLYLLFPWFSKVLRKYSTSALVGFCLMSWGFRYLILTYNIVPIDLFWRWFPLCNAFEFCLGIYIVQTGMYPKNVNTSPIIQGLSDISYYVFLFHTLIISAFLRYLYYPGSPLSGLNLFLTSYNKDLAFTLMYSLMIVAVLIISWIVMKIDARLRSWIMKKNAIRNFLKA